MSEETDADIVLDLIALATYAERADHWTDEKRLMDAAGVADTVYGAIDRIEELETKLAKAVKALDESVYLLAPDEKDMMRQAGVYRIVTTLAELKGEAE